MAVRDKALADAGKEIMTLPQSDQGKEHALRTMEQSGRLEDEDQFKVTGKAHEILSKMARDRPYYDRNRAKICTFFIRGACRRGAACPYRHEKPPEGWTGSGNIQQV